MGHGGDIEEVDHVKNDGIAQLTNGEGDDAEIVAGPAGPDGGAAGYDAACERRKSFGRSAGAVQHLLLGDRETRLAEELDEGGEGIYIKRVVNIRGSQDCDICIPDI